MSKKYQEEYEAGYSPRLVMEEASRCLLCLDAPCSQHCPAGTDPAKFIRSVRFKNIKGAAETVRINNALGAICARVCPTERYCQEGCSRSGIDKPIDIGRIQRYITDFEAATKMEIWEPKPLNGKKVAVVGSGPGGLTAAAELALEGFKVTIYEKDAQAGGYLRYGIPEYRLSNSVVDREINRIVRLGVDIALNTRVGVDVSLEDLEKENDAVVISIGSCKGKVLPMFENNRKVKLAVDWLKQVKSRKGKVKIPENVLVIGGGDVAMDTVTTLKLLGCPHVTDVVYEQFNEFRASEKELKSAQEQGVTIIDGYIPVGTARGGIVKFKHRIIPSELKIKADLIILAVGQCVDPTGLGLEINRGEVTFEGNHLKNSKIFVAGDIAHGEKTVVWGVRTGKEVAYAVRQFVRGK
ncbi:MAG: FAD-dependent oxidoreductase [Bacilli bacterium]|jgi:dihydropyrimidine dehydrogenase (NAD+) subunit PreT|nr:FAD-dependent oxidoreductase [Bacilli bacterium]MDD3841551.1 FAD-dependent oxidoreductase [Bacilli bacterium]HKM10388.1 FAD-dependent oxidoreductase [Bacilli bacterium]